MVNEIARAKYAGKTITGDDIEKSAKKLGPTGARQTSPTTMNSR